MSKNKLIVPEAQQAINDLKMEIAQEMGLPTISGMKSNMYPAIVNGLSVREMVRKGEQILVNKEAPSDTDIYWQIIQKRLKTNEAFIIFILF